METEYVYRDLVPKLNTGRIALLDADFIKYIIVDRRRKQLLDKTTEGQIYLKESPIITLTKDYIQSLIFDRIEDPVIFCFSGKSFNTFRNQVCFEKQYKETRGNTEEAYAGATYDSYEVVKYITETYASLLFEDLEADDIVSALQDDTYTYIISKDKDLKQVPGYHYDFETNTIYQIDNKNAAYNLAYQLLAGDTVDCIPGFPAMGDVKTKNFLANIQNPSYYVITVLHEYQKKFGIFKGTDMFAENWMLIKTRMDRGKYFKGKYAKMFDTKEFFINKLKANMK